MGKFYFGDDMKFVGSGEIGTLTFDDRLTDCMTDFRVPLSDKEELSFECEVNPSLFSQLVGGIDLSSYRDASSYTLIGKLPERVQIRRHKKKRINKKWAKRYGYKTIYKNVQLTDVHFDPSYAIADDGAVTFTGISFDANVFK